MIWLIVDCGWALLFDNQLMTALILWSKRILKPSTFQLKMNWTLSNSFYQQQFVNVFASTVNPFQRSYEPKALKTFQLKINSTWLDDLFVCVFYLFFFILLIFFFWLSARREMSFENACHFS